MQPTLARAMRSVTRDERHAASQRYVEGVGAMIERHDEPRYPIEAISMLKADHRQIHDLFAQYESTKHFATKRQIAEQVFTELDLHTQLEENVFYPAYAARTGKNGTQLVADSRLAHE